MKESWSSYPLSSKNTDEFRTVVLTPGSSAITKTLLAIVPSTEHEPGNHPVNGPQYPVPTRTRTGTPQVPVIPSDVSVLSWGPDTDTGTYRVSGFFYNPFSWRKEGDISLIILKCVMSVTLSYVPTPTRPLNFSGDVGLKEKTTNKGNLLKNTYNEYSSTERSTLPPTFTFVYLVVETNTLSSSPHLSRLVHFDSEVQPRTRSPTFPERDMTVPPKRRRDETPTYTGRLAKRQCGTTSVPNRWVTRVRRHQEEFPLVYNPVEAETRNRDDRD